MPETETPPIRIVLVDDHQIIRDGLREFIESRPGMLVVGDAGDRDGAVRTVARERPDVVVLDLDLGGVSGLELLPEILRAAPAVSVIILTGLRDTSKRDRAMELGAKGVVLKDEGATELLSAIEKVHRTGDYWLEAGAAKRILERRLRAQETADPEAAKITTLTEREREILGLVADGSSNKDIALRLTISERTARTHVSNILRKLGLSSRTQAALWAVREGLSSGRVP